MFVLGLNREFLFVHADVLFTKLLKSIKYTYVIP